MSAIRKYAAGVFPAHAGMNRGNTYQMYKRYSVPRTRGDEPVTPQAIHKWVKCSPHTRG